MAEIGLEAGLGQGQGLRLSASWERSGAGGGWGGLGRAEGWLGLRWAGAGAHWGSERAAAGGGLGGLTGAGTWGSGWNDAECFISTHDLISSLSNPKCRDDAPIKDKSENK